MALKNPFKVLLTFLLICFIFIVLSCAYVLMNGRTIILTELEKQLGIKAGAASVRIGFPLSIVVENFAVKDNIHADKIVISPSLLGFLKGDIVFNSCILDRPYLKITRNVDGVVDFGVVSYKKKTKPLEAQDAIHGQAVSEVAVGLKEPQEIKQKRNFYVKRLKIKNGVIDFVDEYVSPGNSFRLRLDGFNVDLFPASFMSLSRVCLQAQGRLNSQNNIVIGNVIFDGWLDFLARDMDMKVRLTDARPAYLGPYCVNLFKKELESGNMMASADLKSCHNDLRGDFHIEFDHIVFKNDVEPSDKNSLGVGDFVALAFDSVLSTQGKIIFDFFVQTKMDQPRFENVRFKGAFLENSMKTIVSKGSETAVQMAAGGTKETIEDFKAIGKKFEGIGKQFKDMFTGDN